MFDFSRCSAILYINGSYTLNALWSNQVSTPQPVSPPPQRRKTRPLTRGENESPSIAAAESACQKVVSVRCDRLYERGIQRQHPE